MTPRSSDRIARFVDAYGWRAYAVPALAILTVVMLVSTLNGRPGNAEQLPAAAPVAAQTPAAAPTGTAAVPPAPDDPAPATPTPGYLQSGSGDYATVPGTGEPVGSGQGLVKYAVQVEGGIDIDPAAFAARVDAILADPRSWTATGEVTFQRVDTDPDMVVMLVTSSHVESQCPGYQTNGYTSCRAGDKVVINLARWSVGVEHYGGDLETYRDMVINHEVGHYLGHGHVSCPGPGKKAPVMQQQTLSLKGCAANAWPYPSSPAEDVNRPS